MLALLLPALLHAQQPDPRTTGTTYVLAFPDTVTNTSDPSFPNPMVDRIYLYIYSAVDYNNITVTGTGYNRALTAQAGKFTIIELTDPAFKAPAPVVTQINVRSKNTFRVVAQQPIVVYCYLVTKFGSEAWTPAPVESWGREYYAQALPGEKVNDITLQGQSYQAKPKMAPGEIVIVAAIDNTVVTILSTASLLGTSGVDSLASATVTLNKDEAFMVQGYVDTTYTDDRGDAGSDLAGTYISATKPIGVLSGNTRAVVQGNIPGLGMNSFRNMMMEWVAPIEQHGREFVYMPTMDDRRPKGTPGEDVTQKRSAEFVRIYNTSGAHTIGYLTDPSTGGRSNFAIHESRQFVEERIGVPEAVVFKTDKPTQAFMNTSAVVKFLGTTGGGGDAKYDGWGTYAVEMVPREQWVTSAPYFAPIHPSNMEHFLNVVTDSVSAKKLYWGTAGSAPTNPVLLNKPIKGTDLVWGSITVNPGLDLFMTGWNATTRKPDTSVKFYAVVYGLYKGHEEWTPGAADYKEYLAVSYGYPLAPSRSVLSGGDSLRIDSTQGCLKLSVNITVVNDKPAGLRSVVLDSSNNAKIVYVAPSSPSLIIGSTSAKFEIVPINPLLNASAVVVITDRTNKVTRFRYNYESEYLNVVPNNPALLDFGEVTKNSSVTRNITLNNPLNKNVVIKSVQLVLGNQEFRIIKPAAAELPITLKSNDTLRIEVEITPTIEHKLYEDSVKIAFGCAEVAVKVQAETVSPCLYIDDYNFGVLRVGQDTSRIVQICNLKRGYVSFNNPAGGDVITWLNQNFLISQADRDMLKDTTIGPFSCVSIEVTFRASQFGVYKTTARFWASTRDCRDTSIWTAIVTNSAGVAERIESGTALTRIDPNPLQGKARIEFTLGTAGHATLEIFDISGRRVATLVDGEMQAGAHAAQWDASQVPAGTYYCRLTVGEWSTTRTLIVQ